MLKGNGTEGRTRTDTVSPPPDFESGASTSSATPASKELEYIKVILLVNANKIRESFFKVNQNNISK